MNFNQYEKGKNISNKAKVSKRKKTLVRRLKSQKGKNFSDNAIV